MSTMLVDLSVPINEETPVYPGDPKTTIAPAGILSKDGYCDHYVSFGTHAGTHMDAPAHMIHGGKNLNEFPIETFAGRGVRVPVEGKFNLASIQEHTIQADDIVLFHTGMSE